MPKPPLTITALLHRDTSPAHNFADNGTLVYVQLPLSRTAAQAAHTRSTWHSLARFATRLCFASTCPGLGFESVLTGQKQIATPGEGCVLE